MFRPGFLMPLAFAILFSCQRRMVVAAPAVPDTGPDPPDRVARLSLIQGAVSLKPAGTDEWVPAELNRPLTTGDALWCDSGARAELQTGSAALRLDERTGITFLNLDDHTAQVKVTEGVLAVHVRRMEDNDVFEIDTPAAAFTLLRTGQYRVGVAADKDQTVLTVRSGQVDVSGGSQSFVVRAAQQARLTGRENASYEIVAAPPLDPFDSFCRTRDQREDQAESGKYVSPSVIGREDLDEHGSWHVHASYGPVWAPRGLPPGWAPYRHGHWIWIEPWGWTWVDDAPWGFAPFHYGRWVYVEWGWVWVPGPVRIRAVYSPALVVFVGGGGRGYRHWFHVGIGVGVAWFPLGPHEVYVPAYRSSRHYVTNINVSNTIIHNTANIHLTNVERQRYVNRGVRGAITATPEDTFRQGRPVARSSIPVSEREAAAARIGGTAPPVVPDRRSAAPLPEGAAPARRPPDQSSRRQVVVRQTPPSAPVPFEQRRQAYESDPGRPQRAVDETRRTAQPPVRPREEARPPRTATPRPETPRTEQRAERERETRKRQVDQERSRAETQKPKEGRERPEQRGRRQ